jgi:hypothetical protein
MEYWVWIADDGPGFHNRILNKTVELPPIVYFVIGFLLFFRIPASAFRIIYF